MKILRLLFTFIALVGVSYGVHILAYGQNYSLETASNALFVVGVVSFLPAFIVHTGSFEIFDGMRYVFSLAFIRNFKQQYNTFSSYKEERNREINTTFFMELMIASGVIILVGIYLAYEVMN